MTRRSGVPDRLEVSRADLIQALKIITHGTGNYAGDASLRFEDGLLSIEAGNSVAKMPASGIWPVPVYVDASWVRRMAKKMPEGEPIRLRVAEGRIYANRYSETCAFAAREHPLITQTPPFDERRLILAAAKILKPLHVTLSDLDGIVSDARTKGTLSWLQESSSSPEEQKMIAIIAKAWVLLAPLGVEGAGLRRLIDKTVRNAWK